MNEKVILNEEQLKAVNIVSGNLLILASAGTGKTTTIVERYVNLVENENIKPEEIMMTTFTKKAAEDMVRKISKRTNKIPKYIGTMHSLFLKILRKNAEKINLDPYFTLLTEDNDKIRIIKSILIERNIEPSKENLFYFLKRIGKLKNMGIYSEDLDENSDLDKNKDLVEEEVDGGEFMIVSSEIKKLSNSIYKQYQKTLKKLNTLDYDDILLFTYVLFQKNEEFRKRFKESLKAIMVDEAQDLNVVQRNILELLENNNLCLIGDDCQNIYSWRGSSNELIFNFDNSCQKIILKDNYRSSKKIINNVNKIIDSIVFKIDKKLTHTRDEGENVKVKKFYDFKDEILFIANEVKSILAKNEDAGDIAILFRTNNIGKQIERFFRKNRIPCHLSRSKSFFEREEVKDILSFLKLKINPSSVLEFERVLNLIEGVGESKIVDLKNISSNKKINVLDSLDELNVSSFIKEKFSRLKAILNDEGKNSIRLFLDFFDYEKVLEKKYSFDSEKFEDKKENIKILIELSEEYDFSKEGVRNFLDSLIEVGKKEKDLKKVTLTTIHSAKGLEWKHTYISGCNETILPFYRGGLTKIKRDDELRLFYVAVSRAKDFLTITHSGIHNWRELEPSQFLRIIDRNFERVC